MQRILQKSKILIILITVILFLIFLNSCLSKKGINVKEVRFGYMLNVTHATPIVALEKKFIAQELDSDVNLKPIHFVVGNNIIDAFITNHLDVGYIGPGPFINALYKNLPLKLLSGTANGGTIIVVRKDLNSAISNHKSVLRIAVPQFGNTQDLLLRSYLSTDKTLAGFKNLIIHATPPPEVSTGFYTMSIDAACLPEPWGTILIEKGIAKLLVNEQNILSNGNYPTTLLVVKKDFAEKYPEVVNSLINGHKKANQFILDNPDETINIVKNHLEKNTGSQVDSKIIKRSLSKCTFTNNVELTSIKKMAQAGVKAGYYKKDLADILETYFSSLSSI